MIREATIEVRSYLSHPVYYKIVPAHTVRPYQYAHTSTTVPQITDSVLTAYEIDFNTWTECRP